MKEVRLAANPARLQRRHTETPQRGAHVTTITNIAHIANVTDFSNVAEVAGVVGAVGAARGCGVVPACEAGQGG